MTRYIFTVGKGNALGKLLNHNFISNPPPSEPSRATYISHCYYDWFSIKKITDNFDTNESDIVDTIMEPLHREISASREFFSKNGLRVLQNIVLMTDARNDLLAQMISQNGKRPSVLYVSFINMRGFSVLPNDVTEKLPSDSIGLYRTLDHCEYIMIGNGDKISLSMYVQTAKVLRGLKDSNDCNLIYDITSTYGIDYTADSYPTDKINALIKFEFGSSLSTVHFGAYNEFLGRFDNVCPLKTTYAELIEKVRTMHKEKPNTDDKVYKIFIGTDGESEEFVISESSAPSTLAKHLCDVYSKCHSAVLGLFPDGKDRSDLKNILLPLDRIYEMLYGMIDKDMSRYYAMCIYESFVGLLNYIDNKIIEAEDESFAWNYAPVSPTEIEIKKRKKEVIIDLVNRYYSAVQLLANSMHHNDHKYINTDPYQITYCDIPPQLVAFYTAVAHQIIETLKTPTDNQSAAKSQYTVMIVPELKESIYVDSPTKSRDKENEQNLLIIHINECCIYNIIETILTIAHEIAHHVGQTAEHRKYRSHLYFRCSIAIMISEIFSDTFGVIGQSKILTEVEMCIFNELVDELFNLWMPKFTKNIANSAQRREEYYSHDTLSAIVKFFDERIDDRKALYNDFRSALKTVLDRDGKRRTEKSTYKYYAFAHKISSYICYTSTDSDSTVQDNVLSSLLSKVKKSSIRSFEKNLILNIIAQYCTYKFSSIEISEEYEGEKQIYPLFRQMRSLFSEGMADVQMFALLHSEFGHEANAAIYDSKINDKGATDDQLRWYTVRNNINSYYGYPVSYPHIFFNGVRHFCDVYIREQASQYFDTVRTPRQIFSTIDHNAGEKQPDLIDLYNNIDKVPLMEIIQHVVCKYYNTLKKEAEDF